MVRSTLPSPVPAAGGDPVGRPGDEHLTAHRSRGGHGSSTVGKTHRPYTLEHALLRLQNATFASALVRTAGTARQMRAPHLPMVVRTHWNRNALQWGGPFAASALRDAGSDQKLARLVDERFSVWVCVRSSLYPQLFAAAVLTDCMRSLPSSTARPMAERMSLRSCAAVSHLFWCSW